MIDRYPFDAEGRRLLRHIALAWLAGVALALLVACGSSLTPTVARPTEQSPNTIQRQIDACDARGHYSAIYRGVHYCSARPIAILDTEDR